MNGDQRVIIKNASRESDESNGTDPSWSSYSNAMGSQAIKPKRDVGQGDIPATQKVFARKFFNGIACSR